MGKISFKEKIKKGIKKRHLEKYARLFSKEFGTELATSTDLRENEFLDLLLLEIRKQYKKKSNKPKDKSENAYLNRQEIIMNSKINILENQKIDYTYITSLLPSMVTLLIFATNVINTSSSDAKKMIVSLYEKHMVEKEQLKVLSNVISNTNKVIMESTGEMILKFIIMIFVLSATLEWIKLKYKQSNEFKNEFNKMCLSIIKQIQNE